MLATVCVGWLGVVTPANAGDVPVRLILAPDAALPFSTGDLQAAVEARLPVASADAGTVTPVRVGPGETAEWVSVSIPTGRQDVWVAGKGAGEAARLVALAVVDLTRPPGAAPVVADTETATESIVVTAAGRPSRSPAVRFAAGLFPGVSNGLGEGIASFEPTLELSAARARSRPGGWALALSVGYSRASTAWRDQSFSLSTLPARLGARWSWRAIEIAGGAAGRVYGTGGLDGGRGALLGGFGAVGVSGALGAGFRWVAIAACDVYSETLVFRAAGDQVLRAGPVIVWLGAGARWGGGAS